MFPTPSSSANVPRHLPSPPPSPLPGDEQGLCGLTGDQWHMVMKFSIPREWAIHYIPPILSILMRYSVSRACSTVLLPVAIALLISLYKEAEISFLWLGVQDRFNTIRMGAYSTSISFIARY